MIRRCLVVILLVFVAVSASGCWNNRELTNMSIVVGMGVDAVPGSDEYKVSFQVVNSGASGSAGRSQGGSNMLPISVFTEQDNSLFGALRRVSLKAPRRLFFGHIQLVVIGDKVAEKGLDEIFDFFERSHEVRLSSTVLISRNISAEKVISMVTPLERISSIGMAKRTRISSGIWAENADVSITDVIEGLVSAGEPVIGGVSLIGDSEVGVSDKNLKESKPPASLKVRGISLLQDGKLAGWIDGYMARTALLLRNEIKSAVIELPCKDSNRQTVLTIVRSKSRIKPTLSEGKLKFDVNVRESGNIVECNCPIDLGDPAVIAALQKQWEETTKKEVQQTIKAIQQKKSDILGFNAIVERKYPNEWTALEKEWKEKFADSEAEVSVQAYIRRTGMRSKSFQEEISEKDMEK